MCQQQQQQQFSMVHEKHMLLIEIASAIKKTFTKNTTNAVSFHFTEILGQSWKKRRFFLSFFRHQISTELKH